MVIENTGNVGIGTTTPGTALDVHKTNAGVQIRAKTTTSGVASLKVEDATGGVILLRGDTGDSYINSGGNVGIGTTTPSQKLHVEGNVNITGNLTVGGLGMGVPANTISAFYQPTCPTGWILADGTSGTPDLRGIFIRGAGTNSVLSMANGTAFSATYGQYQNDSFQSHYHNTHSSLAFSTGTTQVAHRKTGGVASGEINEPSTAGAAYGPPRIGAETRPASFGLIYCMKTTEDTVTSNTIWGESGDDIVPNNSSKNLHLYQNLTVDGTIYGNTQSYDTGWISNSDWTDQHLGTAAGGNVVHNLNAPLSDILVKVLISTDGSDANSFEVPTAFYDYNYATVYDIGLTIYAIDNNNIKVQTGQYGAIRKIGDIPAETTTIVGQNWYYKIKVFKLG